MISRVCRITHKERADVLRGVHGGPGARVLGRRIRVLQEKGDRNRSGDRALALKRCGYSAQAKPDKDQTSGMSIF